MAKVITFKPRQSKSDECADGYHDACPYPVFPFLITCKCACHDFLKAVVDEKRKEKA